MKTKEEMKSHLNTLVLEFAKEKAHAEENPRFSSRQRERLFFLAIHHLKKEEYELAIGFFRFLVLLDPGHQAYWSSLESALLLSQQKEVLV